MLSSIVHEVNPRNVIFEDLFFSERFHFLPGHINQWGAGWHKNVPGSNREVPSNFYLVEDSVNFFLPILKNTPCLYKIATNQSWCKPSKRVFLCQGAGGCWDRGQGFHPLRSAIGIYYDIYYMSSGRGFPRGWWYWWWSSMQTYFICISWWVGSQPRISHLMILVSDINGKNLWQVLKMVLDCSQCFFQWGS